MQETLQTGTAAALGNMLKDETAYHYYAKTGTTGDDETERPNPNYWRSSFRRKICPIPLQLSGTTSSMLFILPAERTGYTRRSLSERMIRMIERSAVFNAT